MRLLSTLGTLLLPLLLAAQSIPVDDRVHLTENFTAVRAAYIYKVEIVDGERASVRIDASDNIRDKVDVSLQGETLRLKIEDWTGNGRENTYVRVYLVVPDLREIDVAGAASVEVKEYQSTSPLEVSVAGAGRLRLEGSGEEADIKAAGAGRLDAEDYRLQRCKIDVAGAASAEVNVRDEVEGRASGASRLRVKGNPKQSDLRASGAARVRGE